MLLSHKHSVHIGNNTYMLCKELSVVYIVPGADLGTSLYKLVLVESCIWFEHAMHKDQRQDTNWCIGALKAVCNSPLS